MRADPKQKKNVPNQETLDPREKGGVGVDRLGSVEWVNVIYYYEQNLGVLSVCKARS